jgi:hypothetical protein
MSSSRSGSKKTCSTPQCEMAILSREPTTPDPDKKDGHFTVCAMR